MKRTGTTLLCLLGGTLCGLAQTPSVARLRWQNSETMPGEIVSATAERLVWKSSFFESPVALAWHSLRRIDQNLPSAPVADTFTVSLRDGSQIHGELTGITADTVSLRSTRHGDVTLKRSEVLNLRRLKGSRLVWSGPVGDVGWVIDSTPRSPGNVLQLVPGPGGTMVMPYWNRSAMLAQKTPDRVEVDFAVRSTERPDFQLGLRGPQGLRIETWDNELVVAQGTQYQSLRLIGDEERQIALRIHWDQKTAKGAAFTLAGEPVATWQFKPDSGATAERVTLKGKGRDLTLELLRLRELQDQPPAKFDEKLSRTELADGRVLTDKIIAGTGDALTLDPGETGPPRSVPLADVDTLILSPERPQPKEGQAKWTYADGTLLAGEVDSIKEGSAFLRTSFTPGLLSSRVEGVRQVLLNVPRPTGVPPEPPFSELDKLVIQGATLHGKFIAQGDARARWQLVGAASPAIPTAGLSAEITRSQPAPVQGAGEESPALFYTVTGDVLPGRLVALDRNGVEFESQITSATRLPAASLAAVQFSAGNQTDVKSFLDPGWRVVKGTDATVKREGDKLNMEVGTTIAHWSVMQSSEIKFTITSSNFSTFRLRLFCSGGEDKATTSVIVAHFGSQIYSGLETEEGQLNERGQINVVSGKPTPIKLVVQEKHVELHINGVKQHRFLIDPSRRAGMGLIIEPCSVWGNQTTPVALNGFSAKVTPGTAMLPDVSPETRAQALTVPRFRKEDAPRHALIAANGDVLRGEIEAVTPTHLGFRSGLENLRVPRDRVKAAVWLKKPAAEKEEVHETGPRELAQLNRVISRRTTYSNAQLSTLINVIKSEAGDVVFKLPEKKDTRGFRFQFGSQTVKEALDEVCRLFGLRYRIESGNTVVLEATPQADPGQVFQAYWLKAGSLEKSTSTQKLLADLGIGFPAGSSASWDPAASLLSMTNTTENHEKLKALMQSKWGGSLGSPTHWLLLTNGGRLGLAVQKFEPEFVYGTHPVYGSCKVPQTHIYMMRATPPEISFAMKSLMDWQLVNAPEPVIPDPSGNSSPLVGTEAKPFKLPLLAGGEFDLAQEKGKVIVLDFWATWCGPCIKSLPGLIETIMPFPADKVRLIGVNQGEPAEQVKRFLETRNWDLKAALDSSQAVGRLYQVEGIPHTVVIGPDGKIAMVKTGYSPENDPEISAVVKKLLAPQPQPQPQP